jgi:hypothetical protein
MSTRNVTGSSATMSTARNENVSGALPQVASGTPPPGTVTAMPGWLSGCTAARRTFVWATVPMFDTGRVTVTFSQLSM